MLAGISRAVISNVPKTMTRNVNVVSGPALNPISGTEKAIYGVGMVSVWLFVPAWVLSNIKHYRATPAE